MRSTFSGRCLFGAALVFLLLADSVAAQAGAGAAANSVLGPGDLVRITVFRKPELSGEVEIAENGTLLHPLYRDLRAGGLTVQQLEPQLAAYLARFEAEPAFVVEPLVRVTITGEVRQPQIYTLRPSTTVFRAVTAAGGITAMGRPSRVLLIRGGVTQVVNVATPGSPGASEVTRSGDMIVVERRSNFVREVLAPAASLTSVLLGVINLVRAATRD